MLLLKRVYFPCGFQKEFEYVKLDYRSLYEWQFFTFFQKARDNNMLQCFNEKSINFRTERIAACFRESSEEFVPKFICTSQFLQNG